MKPNTTLQGIARRKQILAFVIQYMTDNGFAPSNREIRDGVGLKSTEGVKRHLDKLEKDGKIKTKPGQPRAISVVGYEFRKVEARCKELNELL